MFGVLIGLLLRGRSNSELLLPLGKEEPTITPSRASRYR
jgi:hypothetical protein